MPPAEHAQAALYVIGAIVIAFPTILIFMAAAQSFPARRNKG